MWKWLKSKKNSIFILAALAGIFGFIFNIIVFPKGSDETLVNKLVEEAKGSEKLQQKSGDQEKLVFALASRYADNDPENFEAALAGLEQALKANFEELQKNPDVVVSAVLKKIDALNKEGDLDAAQNALDAEVTVMELDATAMEEEAARHKTGLVRLFEKGVVQAILTRSPETAARYIWKIADNETTSPDERLARLRLAEDDWHVRGRDKGLNFDLEVAIAINRRLLEEYTRERVPLNWAATQNNLGGVLQTLGERESGTQRLEEAVTAFRAALEEHTREREPLNWAAIQNNLGVALQTLGGRESGTQRLEEAVTAYRAALEELTREREPVYWAMTQNNLGNALQILGERESGTQRLEEAVTAFRAALERRYRRREPLNWAMTQNNLGNALRNLGERENGTRRLEEAVTAFSNALEEYTRELVPLKWAMTQENLGIAEFEYMKKARATGDEASVETHRARALEHVGAAHQVYDPDRSSHYHTNAQALRKKIEAF